ncbi:MAG: aromatic ring-hydroxylating dioxygenase subunit alpha [Myxococcales bacterium]|nr:aromatic ring-hydroxylating dioxygenase subunit alpha [Myxococcales bacterium]
MLTEEENTRLTRVGPGTPMGELMRRYWHPVAAVSQLDERPVLGVRLLGEKLVLFRDKAGRLGLTETRCPHRGVNLVAGIPDEQGIRCPYHGWVFDSSGRCVEQPFESRGTGRSLETFKEKCSIKSYPVEELGGLVFAYIGPQPAPLLPRWDFLLRQDMVRDIGLAKVPCNWLQCHENAYDPVHFEFLHGNFANYVLDRLGQSHLRRRNYMDGKWVYGAVQHQRIAFDPFEYGTIKRRLVNDATEESEPWRIGAPLIFPNQVRFATNGEFRVPLDDTTTLNIFYNLYPPEEGEPRQSRIPYYEVPITVPDEDGNFPWDELDSNSGQDSLVWHLQGAISDRTRERLGRSDEGVIAFRRQLKEEMDKVARGEDPMNVFRDPAKNQCLSIEAYVVPIQVRSAFSAKYSPVLNERAERRRGAGGPESPNAYRAEEEATLVTNEVGPSVKS